MTPDEIIREKIDFIKIEYQQLKSHSDFLEDNEWKIRQFSITLWLASVAVGLGLQGITSSNFYILLISAAIPYFFLYMDARIGRWIGNHKARLKQIELFLSSREYTVPSTGKQVSFVEFCSNPQKSYTFPVLDFNGKATCGNDVEFIIDTGATFPHMKVGLRRIFYQSQIIIGLLLLSIQLYSIYHAVWAFSIIAIGPGIDILLVILAKIREKNLRLPKTEKTRRKK